MKTATKKTTKAKAVKTKKFTTELVAQIGVTVLLCIFPLYLQNKYMEMTHAKMMFFCVCSVLLFAVINMTMLSTEIEAAKKRFSFKKPYEIALLCFAGFGIISCLQSSDITAALKGSSGRYMGLITIILLSVTFFVISKFFRFTAWVVYAFAGATVLINIIGFLQLLGFDPFGFYVNATAETVNAFVSTIGNRDVYYSYLCLIIPFFMYIAGESEDKVHKIIYNIALFSAFLGIFAAKSDGIYLGFGGAAIAMIFSVRKKKAAQKSLIHSFMLFFTAAVITTVFVKFGLINYYALSYLSQLITKVKICVPLFIFALIVYVIISFVKIPEKALSVIFTSVFVLSLLCIAGVLVLFIYFSFINKTADIGRFSKYLRFNDTWGSNRGYIWKNLLKLFGEYPFVKKLFGCGEDCLSFSLTQYLGTLENAPDYFTNRIIDTAHNDFLHILVNHGLIGLISYVGFIFHTMKSAYKASSALKKAALMSAFGYLLQSTVNLWQPITTPLFFVFLALAVSKEENE